MRSCDQAPETSDVILERGDNCVKSFKKRFREQPIVRLGTGSIGTVFSVYSQKRDDVKIAVKVLPYGENLEELANRELGIACELNSLKRETPVFVRTIGYIIRTADGQLRSTGSRNRINRKGTRSSCRDSSNR